jgi:hypothetical protein
MLEFSGVITLPSYLRLNPATGISAVTIPTSVIYILYILKHQPDVIVSPGSQSNPLNHHVPDSRASSNRSFHRSGPSGPRQRHHNTLLPNPLG